MPDAKARDGKLRFCPLASKRGKLPASVCASPLRNSAGHSIAPSWRTEFLQEEAGASLQPCALLKARSRLPAWATVLRAFLLGRGEFLLGQTRPLGWSALCLRAHLPVHVPAFPSPAFSTPLLSTVTESFHDERVVHMVQKKILACEYPSQPTTPTLYYTLTSKGSLGAVDRPW